MPRRITIQRKNLRVLLTSEHPEARRFLREVAEKEAVTIIVGEAEDATKAVTMARNLRPDVAVIDSYLPHIGLDSVPLSRTGGLDAAQTICEQMPNTRVILVNNLDTMLMPKDVGGLVFAANFYRERIGVSIPFALQELYIEEVVLSIPVFTNIEIEPWAPAEQKGLLMADEAMIFGSIGIVGGCSLIITIMLAPPGFF